MDKGVGCLAVFVLAKNEEANIERCLHTLRSSGWPVYVLDSGSTDATKEIVDGFNFAQFTPYRYSNHCNAYNEVISELGAAYRYVLILDSDMVVSDVMQRELCRRIDADDGRWDVLEARVEMCMEGLPMHRGSLYPPKPILFTTGKPCFVVSGHAERVDAAFRVEQIDSYLKHDDRKDFASFLQSQCRYSRSLLERSHADASFKDRLRINTPLLIFAVPFVSYVLKLGFLSGQSGILYALDRLIAEAVMYRQSLADRVKRKVSAKEGADATEKSA